MLRSHSVPLSMAIGKYWAAITPSPSQRWGTCARPLPSRRSSARQKASAGEPLGGGPEPSAKITVQPLCPSTHSEYFFSRHVVSQRRRLPFARLSIVVAVCLDLTITTL